MRLLRTLPTRRLLALIAGLIVAGAGGTAIAVAAIGGGPVPPRTTLAKAIHRALAGKAPAGISARITFTNNLIATTAIQGSDALLTGATGRLWATAGHLRLELQSGNGDAQLVVNRNAFWIYDPASNIVYEGTLPAASAKAAPAKRPERSGALPSLAAIQTGLNKLAGHLHLSGAKPTDVAGRAAYQVRISPRQSGGLLGAVQLGWDAVRGIPLNFGVYAAGDPTPVLSLAATGISYGSVALSNFAIKPPAGAQVVKLDTAGSGTHSKASHKAPALNFKLVDPARVDGRARSSVRRLSVGGSPAALVVYGQGLSAVAVIERAAKPGSSILPGSGPDGSSGLTLPTVKIGGVSAQELPTALGTVLQLTRGGVSYLVAGSVPASVVQAVALGL